MALSYAKIQKKEDSHAKEQELLPNSISNNLHIRLLACIFCYQIILAILFFGDDL